ncbi:broad substrate specificity ATP-binding cassette transporter ABCG2-like isoform X1 [Dysidea avara]|uniref:broad substrate specificity ATP-binding cassette transporter ABCG2-like isoform X1 n=1 Tax=Dysidea avara TaxID=196820 RepID=UPI00332B285D
MSTLKFTNSWAYYTSKKSSIAEPMLLNSSKVADFLLAGADNVDDKSVAFHNVTYEVTQQDWRCKELMPKVILKNVSGVMKTGLNIIMGPARCGKTSLLEILSGHKRRKEWTGEVLIDGSNLPRNYRYASTYVVKEDVITGTLTVRENILFSAALRLSCSQEQREKMVDNVIDELELTNVANENVGEKYMFVKGISDEDIKRTNIGMELVVSEGILFVDEPTTGLEIPSAIAVMRTLKNLSTQGRAIIATVYQPQFAMYDMFDSLTLLSRGSVVYHGPAGDAAISYFCENGYEFPKYSNPTGVMLNAMFLSENDIKTNTGIQVQFPTDNTEEPELVTEYQLSERCKEVDKTLASLFHKAEEGRKKLPEFATNYPWQVVVVSLRTIVSMVRNPLAFFMQTIFFSIVAILLGIVYFQLAPNYTGFQNRVGYFIFISILFVYSGLTVLDFINRQRPIFLHHTSRGYYRVSPFFFATVMFDIVPKRLLAAFVYSLISYWMIGLKRDFTSFAYYTLTLLLLSIASSSTAFNTAAGQHNYPLAISVMLFVFSFQLIFGGFIVNVHEIAGWLKWMQYISSFRFALHALFVVELEDRTFCDLSLQSNFSECNPNRTVVGNNYLDRLGYFNFQLHIDEIRLFAHFAVPVLLAYIALRIAKAKRK